MRLAHSILTVLVVANVAAVAGAGHPVWALVAGAAVLAVIAGILSLLPGRRAGPNPFAMYATGIVGLIAVGAFVYALSQLGPLGVLALCAAVVGAVVSLALVLRPGQRERRATAGLCAECGYDLRATEERCPECGAPVPEELLRRRRIAAELSDEARRDAVRRKAVGAVSRVADLDGDGDPSGR